MKPTLSEYLFFSFPHTSQSYQHYILFPTNPISFPFVKKKYEGDTAMFRHILIFLISLTLSACGGGGGGGGYGGNSLTQNNGDTSIPRAGPTTT